MPIERYKTEIGSKRIKETNSSLFATLMLSVLVFVAIVLIFSIAAAVSLRGNLSRQPSVVSQSTSFFEILNYHGTQPPSNFPPQLIEGKVGDLISSQEITSATSGELKFVSFFSKLSGELLVGYYKSYLENSAYHFENSQDGEISQLLASRGNIRYDISVQPQVAGSIVSIYQRTQK